MSYVAIWLQVCRQWRCEYFQTLSRNDRIIVVDWDILYKLCGSANKWSKGFVLSGKIWWQFFSCNEACSKYHTRSTTTPKYTLTQRLVFFLSVFVLYIQNGYKKLFSRKAKMQGYAQCVEKRPLFTAREQFCKSLFGFVNQKPWNPDLNPPWGRMSRR